MQRFLLFALMSLAACNWAKEKTKSTVHKTGEVVGKAGAEFSDGVAAGVQKTFDTPLRLSAGLQAKGLKTGKVLISSTDSTTDNILSVYFIYEQDFTQSVTAQVLTSDNLEYGRTTQLLKGRKGEAGYIDFVFDKRTNIDGKSTVQLQ